MTDLLIITGPVNAQQLRIEELSPGTRHLYVGSGGGTGSSDMYGSVKTWLQGRSVRERALEVEPNLRRLGVIWFSAGHGGVQAMLQASTPDEVQAWLCVDGLYTAWDHRAPWATELAEAAAHARTTMLATASTSTPGQFADSRSAWLEVMAHMGLEPSDVAMGTAAKMQLPEPDEAFQRGAFLLATYENLGHGQQVPQCRQGFMNWWNAVREAEPPPVPLPQVRDDSGGISPLVLALGAVGGVGMLVAAKLLWQRRRHG